jgi:uncharacterized protein YqfA (UPF0365 family)
MNTIIIICFLAIVFGLIFVTSYYLPAFYTKWRASTFGLKLTIGQAKIITNDFCHNKHFFLMVKDIWTYVDIPIEKLTFHYLASPDKDLTNLRDGIIEMKTRNRDIDFTTLATLDLAGKDLKEAVRKAEMNNWTFIFHE